MTKITQIDDRGAAVAWSPINSCADVIALGAKDSGEMGFDDYGGELELYDLGITSSEGGRKPTPSAIGSVKTTSRFASIGWTAGNGSVADRFSMGLIAGGMIDGTVNVWNAKAIGGQEDSLITSIDNHKTNGGGAVTALEFNPHPASANLLATGGSNGEILITSLDNPEQPNTTVPAPDQPKQGAEITNMSWNSQVAHIVASAAGDGTTVVWDLRQQKPWCELRCESNNMAVADLAWNPTQGLHLITASADDRNPLLKLWDLRASTTMPLASLEGHQQGILSTAWCPHDDSLLLSCGKDNLTLLWDLHTLKPIAEIPNEDDASDNNNNAAATQPSDVYGGGLSSSQQKRYDVQWSPIRRGVMSTCSFDRKVQAHSVIGAATKSGRPPKWMKPASGVSCGFGGSVVSFASTHKAIKVTSAVERPDLKAISLQFENSIANSDAIQFSLSKAENALKNSNDNEMQVWGFMQLIFEDNAREHLLQYLGFDPEKIHHAATEFDENTQNMENLSLESKPTPPMSKSAEFAVKQALLVGNFEAAVECCFRSGNMADALILAACGGADLWAKAQTQFFENEAGKRPFLSIVNAVQRSQLDEFVTGSNASDWQETLAVVCTYAKIEEFPILCQSLGDHLENAGDFANASLCYMCALNLEKASKYWRHQLNEAYKTFGGPDFLALHAFVEKVTIFTKALDANSTLPPEVADLFYDYAKVLADQGLFSIAAKYCRADTQKCKELRDRIYRSKDSQYCLDGLGSEPEFPFEYQAIGVAPQSTHASYQKKEKPVSTTPSEVSNQYRQENAYQQQANQPQANQSQYGQQQAVQQQPQNQYGQQQSYQQQSQYGQPTQTQQPAYQQQKQQQNQYSDNSQGLQSTQVDNKQQQNDVKNDLPPGWVALPDPSSGKTYYANQSSGESSWEKPAPVAVTQPSSGANINSNGNTNTGLKNLASKYGDGFVSSSSHPELAEQYGNVGTSNPYTSTARPGTAVVNKTQKAPVSATFDPTKPIEVSEEYKPLTEGLMSYVCSMSSLQLTATEKKQIAEVEKGVAVFIKKLARGDIGSHIVSQVSNLFAGLQNRDYQAANAIHNSLVNTEWKDQKDWLRGMRVLIQLASRKM